MKIIVTGTPGVGKHTITKLLAAKMKAKVIDINKLAYENNAIIGKDYASIVDTDKMKSIIKKELSNNCIIIGHLAPYILESKDVDYAILLRRSPYRLEEVYAERGYDRKKMKDNLSSEILGVIAYDCIANFGDEKIIEIDNTDREPVEVVDEILYYIKNRKNKIGIDWLEIVKDDINRFFNL